MLQAGVVLDMRGGFINNKANALIVKCVSRVILFL